MNTNLHVAHSSSSNEYLLAFAEPTITKQNSEIFRNLLLKRENFVNIGNFPSLIKTQTLIFKLEKLETRQNLE